mgnify:CR=1 FL=1
MYIFVVLGYKTIMKGKSRMINLSRKEELLKEFAENVEANVKENLSNLDLFGFAKSGNMDLVKESIVKIRANIVAAFPYGYEMPKASLYTTGAANEKGVITVLSITLTNSWKSEKTFKFAVHMNVEENIIERVIDYFKEVYEQLLLDMFVEENLEEINKLYEELTSRAGVNYTVKLVSPLNQNNRKIAFISDDEIDFVADINRIFDIDDILVFQEVDMQFTEEKIEAAKEPMVDEIGLAQTVVQFAGIRGGSLIKYLCNIGSQVKAITLIKKVNNKNARRLTGKKDTTAYYENEGVYAVVARRDGNFEVLLKPFDINTLESVDVDVVAELSK